LLCALITFDAEKAPLLKTLKAQLALKARRTTIQRKLKQYFRQPVLVLGIKCPFFSSLL
jgi:hypothetical protein